MVERLFFLRIRGKFDLDFQRSVVLIKKIARGYGNLFSSFLKVVLLAVICLGLGFLLVYPLWLFASSLPSAYTAFVMALICLALLFFVIMSIRKKGPVRFLIRLAKLAIIAGGLFFCVHFVFSGNRLAALFVLLAVFVLYGLLAFGVRKNEKKN